MKHKLLWKGPENRSVCPCPHHKCFHKTTLSAGWEGNPLFQQKGSLFAFVFQLDIYDTKERSKLSRKTFSVYTYKPGEIKTNICKAYLSLSILCQHHRIFFFSWVHSPTKAHKGIFSEPPPNYLILQEAMKMSLFSIKGQ